MRKALLIFSWITVVSGGLSLAGSIMSDYYDEDTFYAFVGGALFLTQGLLAIFYVKEIDKEKEAKKEAGNTPAH
tara:strand:+ start:840 stop:1061 length:222 start_codon:yes stop_codon:yes gene_type:complete